MDYSLLLYERVSQAATSYRGTLTRHIPDWSRSTRAVGGFWMGGGTITSATMGRNQATDMYNTSLGRRLVERAYGLTTWEGEIVQMTLTLDGVKYTRTLDTDSWHNKVKVRYAADETAYSETTGSSDIYGESVYIDILGGAYDATSATGRRDRRLKENAYPRSRPTGGLASASSRHSDNSLSLRCGGYVFSMNRRYQELDIVAQAINTQISTLVGNSEFVTAGRIDVNSTTVPVSTAGIPMRLWNLIEELIEDGDSSGNRYAGGVYEGRKFNYKLAETAITYYWRTGQLFDRTNALVHPALIQPDSIVRIGNAPFGTVAPGATEQDNTKSAYITEVEFIAPNGYRLITAPHFGPSRIEPGARAQRVLIPQFIQLQTPLTSTSWDGDSYSTTAKTKIDLSSVFSAPAGIRAVSVKWQINDSGSAGTDCYLVLAPNNTAGEGLAFTCPSVDDRVGRGEAKVPCDANGDIYYQLVASGASTMDITIEICGYWL